MQTEKQRERLVELIKSAEKEFSNTGKPILDIEEYVADYLLANNVLVLPKDCYPTVTAKVFYEDYAEIRVRNEYNYVWETERTILKQEGKAK